MSPGAAVVRSTMTVAGLRGERMPRQAGSARSPVTHSHTRSVSVSHGQAWRCSSSPASLANRSVLSFGYGSHKIAVCIDCSATAFAYVRPTSPAPMMAMFMCLSSLYAQCAVAVDRVGIGAEWLTRPLIWRTATERVARLWCVVSAVSSSVAAARMSRGLFASSHRAMASSAVTSGPQTARTSMQSVRTALYRSFRSPRRASAQLACQDAPRHQGNAASSQQAALRARIPSASFLHLRVRRTECATTTGCIDAALWPHGRGVMMTRLRRVVAYRT